MDEIKTFLNDFKNEILQSLTSDEIVHPKIVGNYNLDKEDVRNQVIDWVLHYLENKKCPYQLAISIAKITANEVCADISEQSEENKNLDQRKMLNSISLYTDTVRRLPTICMSFLEGSNENEVCSSSCSLSYTASVFAIKNKRRKMEDRHVIHHDLNWLLDIKNSPAHSYYAVFDGHSGVDAASYASAHLHVNIAKHPAFLTDTAAAISEAYKTTDESFLKRCSEENIKSGCTVICALIREKKLYLSWLGDSQAVLVKEGKPVIVTNPHKPDREDERKRIEDLGGEVTDYTGISRVNGILAVTRALGDPDHKRYICSEPEITTIDLDGTEDFLILACDGLWDGMSPEDVTSALYYNLSGSALDEPLDAVAGKLVHQSKLQGSEDNITVVVVFLRDIKTIKDYASQLLPQACSQLNFLEMNGEGKSCPMDGISNSPRPKPTLWELDAAKELKNTANVLSSAGFPGTSYSSPYSEGFIDNMSFQNAYDNAAFLPHQRVASCLAPEATALSELPTPPIDDVLASQQFEKLSSADFYLEPGPFNPTLVDVADSGSGDANLYELEANVAVQSFETHSPSSADLHIRSPAQIVDDLNKMPSEVDSCTFVAADMTPDEAVDIANCVVSNTIENAIKHISSNELSESVPSVPTQKLNPYAEPFVMKSFIQNDNELLISPTSPVSEPPLNILSDINFDTNVTFNNPVGDGLLTTDSTDTEQNKLDSVITPEVIPSEANLLTEERMADDSPANDGFSASPLKTTDSVNTELNKLSSVMAPEVIPSEASILTEERLSDDNPVEDGFSASPLNTIHSVTTGQKEALISVTVPETESSELGLLSSERTTDVIKDGLFEMSTENAMVGELSQLSQLFSSDMQPEMNMDKLIIKDADSNIEQILPSDILQVPKSPDNKTSTVSIHSASETIVNELVTNTEDSFTDLGGNNNLQDMEIKSKTGNAISDVLKDGSHLLEQLCLTPKLPAASDGKRFESYPDVAGGNAITSDDFMRGTTSEPETPDVSSNSALEEQSSTTPDGVAEPIIIVQNVPHNSLIIGTMNEPIATAVLPSDPTDEVPVETFAVDLQTVPDGVPEAEGVTEDIDSDSEKDGGWSYVKPNAQLETASADTKPKLEVSSLKAEKSATKTDPNAKLRKDVLKTAADKSKLKTASPIDKIKKPLVDKKGLDIKDRSKATKSVASTLGKNALEKTVKAPSTMNRIKPKELPPSSSTFSKPSTLKLPRLPATRNTSTLSKSSSLQSTERSQVTSTKSGIGSQPTVGNIRPKSALSTTAARVNVRQANAATNLTKELPSNQSIKSNVTQVTRTTTISRTVPNRDLTKPSVTKSAAIESKTKTLSATVRKTPLSVPLKKPVVKETKDIVNKQISARRNAPVAATTRSEPAKSATRPTTMLSNKTVPIKPRSAPIKNDASKKEVPKPPVSKLTAKRNTPSRISQSAAKGSVKSPLVNKSSEKKMDGGAEGERIVAASTPASEEEKFILEANDKEVKVKDEAALNPDQQLQNLENGDVDASVIPLDEIAPPANCVSESVL